MGGGGSTPRRITIDEDELSGVMRVSESVARRLTGQPETSVSKRRKNEVTQREPNLTAEERDEFRKLENYYKRRIDQLEQRNKELFQEKKDEFAKTVEEVEKKFLKTTASPICSDLQNEILKCYQANPTQTLHCYAQVKAFNDCVQKQREKILTKKG